MNSIFDYLGDKIFSEQNKDENIKDKQKEIKLFSVSEFIKNLSKNSIKNNFMRLIHSNSITAYDISQNCVRQVVYRLLNYPVKSYEDIWLPVKLRQVIGSSIHEFIYQNYSFDEVEVAVKIDEFNFSGRVDAINSSSVLIEIKSVPYKDYENIITKTAPREKDLKQTLVYKVLLERYLDKILKTKNALEKEKTNYNFPKQTSYKFKYLQFIYVAHDLISADTESIYEELALIKALKRKLNSKQNSYYFMKVVTVDVLKEEEKIKKLEKILLDKLLYINECITKMKLPSEKFVNTSMCFFCPYKHICNINLKKQKNKRVGKNEF